MPIDCAPLVATAEANGSLHGGSVMDDCMSMMHASALVYAMADLRELARTGKLSADNCEKINRLPIKTEDVLHFVAENRDDLGKLHGEQELKAYLTSLESVREISNHRLRLSGTNSGTEPPSLVVFNDENHKSELVYAIAVNSQMKRIVVAFRGSVTPRDFAVDANEVVTEVCNPILTQKRSGRGLPKHVGIHSGFHDYLLGKRGIGGGTKCDDIIDNLKSLLAVYPDFNIFITGHSLGGALSALFAFELAAREDEEFSKPITCINFASPRLGNLAFRKSFQVLEREGKLLCLRVSNYKDLVTYLPDRASFSCLYAACCQNYIYRHVGINLELYRNRTCQISHSPQSTGYCDVFCNDVYRVTRSAFYIILNVPLLVCCKEDLLAWHSCREYMERLRSVGPHLETKYLRHLYEEV